MNKHEVQQKVELLFSKKTGKFSHSTLYFLYATGIKEREVDGLKY